MTWIEEIQQMGANLVSEFRRIADETGRKKTTFKIAKKITKLISCTIMVPGGFTKAWQGATVIYAGHEGVKPDGECADGVVIRLPSRAAPDASVLLAQRDRAAMPLGTLLEDLRHGHRCEAGALHRHAVARLAPR